MPKTVEIEGIGRVAFPDEMALEDIQRTIESEIIPSEQRRKARRSQLRAEQAQFENEQAARPTTASDVLGGVAIAALEQGPAEIRRQGYSALEALTRPWNRLAGSPSSFYADRAQKAREDVQRATEEAQTLDPSIGGQAARVIASTAVSSAPVVAASALAPVLAPAALATRVAVGTSALAGAGQSFGAVFNEAKNAYLKQGLTEDEAVSKAYGPAAVSGAITGALTGAFGATGVQAIAKGLTKDSAKGVIRKALQEAGMEATEEGIDQFGQGIVEQASFNPNKSLSDIANEAVLAAIAGGILGGGVNVAADVAGKVSGGTSALLDRGVSALDRAIGPTMDRVMDRMMLDDVESSQPPAAPESDPLTQAAIQAASEPFSGNRPGGDGTTRPEVPLTLNPNEDLSSAMRRRRETAQLEALLETASPPPPVVTESLTTAEPVSQPLAPAPVAAPSEPASVAQAMTSLGGQVDSLYDAMWRRVSSGRYPEPFQTRIGDLVQQAYNAGEIRGPEDIKALAKFAYLPPIETAAPPVVETASVPPFEQAKKPDSFPTVGSILDFRKTRLDEEKRLYQEMIGLSPEQSERLAALIATDRSTERFEKALTPDQRARLTALFEGPLNQVGSSFEFWDHDKRFKPDSIIGDETVDDLSRSLAAVIDNYQGASQSSDRFLFAIITANKLREKGGTMMDVARGLDRYTTNNSSSQGDKEEFFRSLGPKIKAFLDGYGIQLPESKPTTQPTNDRAQKVGPSVEQAQTPAIQQPPPQIGTVQTALEPNQVQAPPTVTTEQPHGFVSLVDFIGSAKNPNVGVAFDTNLPDHTDTTLGAVSRFERQLLTGARQSSAQGSKRSITHKFLAVMDTNDGQVYLLPVYPDTKSGSANTVAPNAAGEPRGQRLSRVLAEKSATDVGTPRYEVLEAVRLKNPARTFPRSFTREEWTQIRNDALAEQGAVIGKYVGDVEPAEGLVNNPTAAVQEAVIPPGHFSENDLRHLFSLLQRNPTLEGFIQAARPVVTAILPDSRSGNSKRTAWTPGIFAPQIAAAIAARPATFDQFYETFDPSGYAEWKERTIRTNRGRILGRKAGAQPGGPPIPQVPGLAQTFNTPEEAVAFLTSPDSPIAADVGNVLVAALTDPALQKSLGALGFKLSVQNSAVKLAESSTNGRPAAYDPVTGTILLAMGIQPHNASAGPHELAHHLETLLPAQDRKALRVARDRAIAAALKNPKLKEGQRAFLTELQQGERSAAWFDQQFQQHGPQIVEFYPLVNTSEFFAQGFSERYLDRINATQQERTLWTRIKEMLRQIWAWMKDRVGLLESQDAAFRRLISGEFDVTARNGMLFDDEGLAGALSHVFKAPNDVAIRTGALDLTPDQVQEIENQAATQTSLIPPNFQASLKALDPNTRTPEGVARRELNFLENLGDVGTVVTPKDLAALPSSTPEEVRAREAAAAGLIDHYLTTKQREIEIGVDLEQAEGELLRAVQRIPDRNKAESEEAMLAAMSGDLLNGYKRYLANQSKLTPANQTLAGRQAALLEAAQRRVADAEVTPSSVRRALNAISLNIPDAVLNTATDPMQIAQWVDANRGLFTGVVADSVRDFMLDNSAGKPPIAYDGLIDHLKAMRDLRQMTDATLQEVQQFKQWFAGGGRPVSVGSDRFAKAYYRWRTQQEKAARVVEAIDKDIAKWDAEVRGLGLAQNKLVELQQSPEWQSGQYLAGKIAQAELRDVMESDRALGTTTYVGPETGKRYTVNLLPDSTVESQNMAELISLVDEAKRYVANPQSDPIARQYWERRIPYLENYRMRPDFNPDQGSTARFWDFGGAYVQINPWNTVRRAMGGLPGTLGSELKTLGGRAGSEALEVVQRADQVEQELETNQNNEQHGGKMVNLAALKAAESHGYQGSLGAVAWERDVLNPILAAGQQAGTPQFKVGDTIPISGKVVTKEDLEAARVQKEWNNGVIRAAQGAPIGGNLKFYSPVQVVAEARARKGEKAVGLNRNTFGGGPLTMARLPSDWGIKFSNAWRNATDAQKAVLLRDPVNFRMAVLGQVAERSPEFRRDDLDGIYEQMAAEMRRGRTYADLDAVLDDMANRMVVARMEPDFALARNRAEATLLAEIDRSVGRIVEEYIPESARTGDPNRPESLIQAVTANNSFTKPRVGLIAPSTYFDYSMTQNERRANFTASLRDVLRLREVEKVKDVIAAYEQLRLQFDERIQKLVDGGMSKWQARRKVARESREAQMAGKIGIDLYGLEQSLTALNEKVSQLERLSALKNEFYDTPTVRILQGTRSFLGSSLLVPLGSAARNTAGSIFMNAGMNRLIGQSLPHLAGSTARATAYTANNLAKQLAYAVTRNPKLARMIDNRASTVRSVTGVVARWINDWQRVQAEMDRIGVSPQTQIGQAAALRNALPETGGRITGRDQGVLADVATGVARAPGVAQTLAPGYRRATEFIKATFPGFFDRAINAAALDYWGRFFDNMKAKAWDAYARRESTYGHGWDDLTANGAGLLEPADIGAGHFQGAKYLRDKFLPAGLLDKVLLDYYNRTKAMTPDQRAAEPLLSPEQDAGVFLEFLKSANVGTESNRPMGTKGSGLSGVGRASLGQFLGMPSEILNELSALSNRSTKDSGNPLKLLNTVAVVMLLAGLIGAGGNEAAKLLNRLTTGESSSAVSLANVIASDYDANTLARWAVSSIGTVLPFIGEPMARALSGTSNKPLLDLTQIVPMAGLATDLGMTLQKVIQTGDIVYPAADLLRRWVPATRPGLLLIPGALGDQAARNASRAVTAAVPPSMEPRKQSGGGAPTQTPMTPILRDLMAAAYAGDQQRVASLYQAAVEEKRSQGSPDPEGSVLSSIQSQVPTRKVLGRVPTAAEEATILGRMSGTQRSDFDKSRRAFALLQQVAGKPISFVKKVKPKTTRARSRGLLGGSRSVLGRRRRQSFPRLRLGSGRSRRTAGTKQKKRRALV